MHQAPWNITVIPEPSLRQTDESSVHLLPQPCAANFPKQQAYSPTASDTNAWGTVPVIREPIECSFLPAPLAPESPPALPQGAWVPIDIAINYYTFSSGGTQMLRAQIPYADDAYASGNEVVPALDLSEVHSKYHQQLLWFEWEPRRVHRCGWPDDGRTVLGSTERANCELQSLEKLKNFIQLGGLSGFDYM